MGRQVKGRQAGKGQAGGQAGRRGSMVHAIGWPVATSSRTMAIKVGERVLCAWGGKRGRQPGAAGGGGWLGLLWRIGAGAGQQQVQARVDSCASCCCWQPVAG